MSEMTEVKAGRARSASRWLVRVVPVAAVTTLSMGLAPPAGAANVAGTVDLIGPFGGTVRSFSTAYDPKGDSIAMGDMTNDPYDEIVIANAGGSSEGGRIDVLDLFGDPISSFGSAYDDDGDSLAVGDITNDGFAEAVVANAGGSSENGRVDVLDLFGDPISSFGTAYDATGDQLAVGDVTGDGAEEIVVANNEGGGRMDVLNLYGHVIASFGNTGYDDTGDTVAVGDVTGDGRADIVVANDEALGRIDVYGGTGGLLHRFTATISPPTVLVGQFVPGGPAEIGIVTRAVFVNNPHQLVVFDRFGTRLRTLSTTYSVIGASDFTDGIAVGPTGTLVVANV